ncbi:HAD family phosphatase [Tetragenococcus koreensis]|uniref:HAD family hydrolase n=1 Tax=Tetragenococcus koreensis TaxID=290335 RepID=UPI001F24C194|nr:HAD family phosphatase [Tetragenococcus koreensis]MCF1618643.1 HAD family phosphatase [Tetragenococcus koreensis]MCF1657822.1 HAD family phosphatase [Tetragenococcus koreensis]
MEKLKYQKGAFFFDMDGLLFDTETLYYETRHQILNKHGYPYTKNDHANYIGKGFDDTIYRLQKLVDDEALGQMIFDESMELFQAEVENGNLPLKRGAVKLLTELNKNGKNCYLTSSSSKKLIMQTLRIARIEEFFSGVISGEEVESNKPAPDIYLHALTIAQTSKEQAVVFEDAKSGIEAAVQAGIDVIMVPDWTLPDEEDRKKTVAVVPNLHEAAALFL